MLRSASAWALVTAAMTAAAGGGCVAIDGGAIEVPWAIFAPRPDGRSISDCRCAEPAIARVRLELESLSDESKRPCDGVAGCSFPCNRKIGATPFFIPPDRYLVTFVAIGEDDQPLSSLGVTPPLTRDVVRGQPTELEAVRFEAPCKDSCGGNSVTTAPCSGG